MFPLFIIAFYGSSSAVLLQHIGEEWENVSTFLLKSVPMVVCSGYINKHSVWMYPVDTFIYIYIYIYIKVKWSRYRSGVAQRVGRCVDLLFHDRGTRRGWVVSSTPRRHFTLGKDPVPILQDAGWAPSRVWTGGKSRPHRDSIPDRPARNQSLYRLSYPAHTHTHTYTYIHIYIYIHTYIHIRPCYIYICVVFMLERHYICLPCDVKLLREDVRVRLITCSHCVCQ